MKLLFITHDAILARAYKARLAREGFLVEHQSTGHDGLAKARQWMPELILLDLTLPGMHGLDVLKFIRDVPPLVQVPVVLLIERTLARDTLNQCLLWGAGSYLQKDLCSLDDVVDHLQTLRAASGHPPVHSSSTS